MKRAKLNAQGDDREKASALRLLVAADSWTGAELRGLPRGGSIRIEAQSDGPVRLLLADKEGYGKFPDVIDALFDRQIEASMVAEITLPRSDDYYLIADNRNGSAAREILLALRGRSHDSNQAVPLPRQFEVLQTQMDAAFDLGGLTLRLADPGPARPCVNGRELIVGQAFIRQLEAELPDAETTRGAILFAIMHAVASDWLSETQRAEILPEHLAAALMILFNQIGSAKRQAEHFATGAAPPGAPDIAIGVDPLSAITARSVLRRLKDPQSLLKVMQDMLFARMRPALLEKLQQTPPAWAEPERIAAARAVQQGAAPKERP